LEDIQQDFTLDYVKWSWSDLELRREKLNPKRRINGKEELLHLDIFNISSFAAQSLSRRLKHQTQGSRYPRHLI
jgi:hypothetical protein